ncbi:MAG: hypothetical protein HZB14_00535 [Actinobacteria bacterium]|nr:hypothetical protein [Actinomycetota bacterium]
MNRAKGLTRGGVAVLIVLVGLAVAAVVAVAGPSIVSGPEGSKVVEGSSQSTPPSMTKPQSEMAAQALEQARAKFSSLRAAESAADKLPEAINRSSIAKNFAGPNAARKVGTSKSGIDFFAIPVVPGAELQFDDAGVCVLEENGAGSCQSIDEIEQGQSLVYADHLPELPSGYARLRGFMPDGVDEVKIATSDGKSLTVPVNGNLFVYEADFSPVSISWSLNGNQHSRAVPGA